jgi:hypothetical protein
MAFLSSNLRGAFKRNHTGHKERELGLSQTHAMTTKIDVVRAPSPSTLSLRELLRGLVVARFAVPVSFRRRSVTGPALVVVVIQARASALLTIPHLSPLKLAGFGRVSAHYSLHDPAWKLLVSIDSAALAVRALPRLL